MAARQRDESEEQVAGRKAFLLRLPPSLLGDLRAWANQDLRSLNAQIEFLLRDALRRRGKSPSSEGDGEE